MSVPGTYKNAPKQLARDLSPEGKYAEGMIEAIGALTAERWTLADCLVMIAREPLATDGYRWHLSISHPSRYPSWDEIKAVVFGLPQLSGVTMAQVLSPDDGSVWVNVHDNCFHLYEIHDPTLVPR